MNNPDRSDLWDGVPDPDAMRAERLAFHTKRRAGIIRRHQIGAVVYVTLMVLLGFAADWRMDRGEWDRAAADVLVIVLFAIRLAVGEVVVRLHPYTRNDAFE